MPLPTVAALVDELDQDAHAGRVRRLALLGRDHRGDPRLGDLLDELAGSGGYWHELALVAAVAAGDGSRVVQGVRSPSLAVRSFAWTHLLRVDADLDAVLDGTATASAVERVALIGATRASGREDIADRWLPRLRATFGDVEAARLLPACSPGTVVAALPELAHAVRSWAALGRRHPAVVLAYFARVLPEAPRSNRDGLWRRYGTGVAVVADSDPDGALKLFEDAGPTFGTSIVLGSRVGRLVRLFPSRVVALLLRPREREAIARGGVPNPVLRNARALPDADRVAVARVVRDNPRHLARFLSRFPPSERAALFDAAVADVDTTATLWPDELLEVLPHTIRSAEAARMLRLRPIADDPWRVLAVTSFLPISDARTRLESALGTSKAEERAVAYRLLVDCTRRSRSPVELRATMTMLQRLRNEQDPVRLAAVTALARVPPHLFDDVALDGVDALVTAVVDARDTSHATVERLRHLMLRFLADGAATSTRRDTALRSLDRLAGPSGTIAFGALHTQLPRGAELRLLAALLPRLRRDADHDRYDLTLSLAAGLGRRGWDLEELQALLQRATRAPLDTTVRRAIDLWLAPPRTRPNRVGALVAADPSVLTVPMVLATVSWSRQDLLDVLLRAGTPPRGGRRRRDRTSVAPLKGRFLSGDVRYVPVITRGVDQWLPRQHRAYADALHSLIADPATKPWTVTSALRTLAHLPMIGADELLRYADTDDVARQEAVLAGLAWTDNPGEHLPRLLAFADTDRARVAVYAASRSARFAAPPDLANALAGVLASTTAKVTARKEAVRLLALHHAPGAAGQLAAIASGAGVHRDVRIAIGRSLRGFLADEASWQILDGLVRSTADDARAVIDANPDDIAALHRVRYAGLVATACAHADPIARAEAFAALARWAAWCPEAAPLAAGHVTDVESGATWRRALDSLVLMFQDEIAADATIALIHDLVTTMAAPEHDAGTERDRPSRQRLGALVSAVVHSPPDVRERLAATIERGRHALIVDPTTLVWQIELALSATRLNESTSSLVTIAGLLDDRIGALPAASAALHALLHREPTGWEPENLAMAADALLERGTPAANALALTLTAAAGPRSGWNPVWRSRLRTLRATTDPDLTAAALAITTTLE